MNSPPQHTNSAAPGMQRAKRPQQDAFPGDAALASPPAKRMQDLNELGGISPSALSRIKRSSLAQRARTEPAAGPHGGNGNDADANDSSASQAKDPFWAELQRYQSMVAEAAAAPKKPPQGRKGSANGAPGGGAAAFGRGSGSGKGGAHKAAAGGAGGATGGAAAVPSAGSQELPCIPVLTPYLDAPYITPKSMNIERKNFMMSLGARENLLSQYWKTRRGIVDITCREKQSPKNPETGHRPRRTRDFDGVTPIEWLREEQQQQQEQ
ncbi:hypothetical protein THASP1DRAFT_31156 [Thamnocephalis sphaerospora]|uniref:Uncharacterized protein n=1 Tax=Thamnocephalis sphaerospora TaxID=78915 RepID=A0A4V1IWC0_9FUNG|nr:hypothetical protein THASP1DRAFT_31156 [Thamnocephalis sphaerospora]|eukprot:RKP07029.1 hypothetical protein THASP1DRAFT_31156 [Thamnocephalis sphaerospora]